METLLQLALTNTLLAASLAVVAAGVGALSRRPALAHGLWLLVLLKLVTPPFVQVPLLPTAPPTLSAEPVIEETVPLTSEEIVRILGQTEPAKTSIAETPSTEMPVLPEPAATEEAAPWTLSYAVVLGLLWAAGSVTWFMLSTWRVARFHRLLVHAQPVPSGLLCEVGTLAKRLGLRRCPEVRFVPGAISPMVWSLGTPLLLLPAELWQRLTDEQRQTLVVHELAHLARRDHWVRGLEFLVTGLYWWNPLVWWARHGLREAEERCCDAWVVWVLPGAARAYATALVETVDFLSEARPVLPAAASGIGHVRILKRRLTMILQGTTPRALSATGFLGLASLAALLLPILPTRAQEPEQRKVFIGLKVEGANEDEAIAELKRRLAELEARRAQKKQAADEKKAEQIEKARAEVKAAAEKLRAAMTRLAELEGGNRLFLGIEAAPFGKQQVWIQNPILNAPPPPHLPAVIFKKRVEAKPENSEERLQRLEKQLADLLREVKELRKEKQK